MFVARVDNFGAFAIHVRYTLTCKLISKNYIKGEPL